MEPPVSKVEDRFARIHCTRQKDNFKELVVYAADCDNELPISLDHQIKKHLKAYDKWWESDKTEPPPHTLLVHRDEYSDWNFYLSSREEVGDEIRYTYVRMGIKRRAKA